MGDSVEIKVQPWKGFDNEIFEGFKSKITLMESRLEYRIKYTQRVEINLLKNGEISEQKDGNNYTDITGVVEKSSIFGLAEYVDTTYEPKEGLPFKLYYVDILYGSEILTISCETKEEQKELYKSIHKWKYI